MKRGYSLQYPVINSVKPRPTKNLNIINSLMKMIKNLSYKLWDNIG